ncbi:MAG: Ig-like domain-containing protein [Bacteroidota bacterium]
MKHLPVLFGIVLLASCANQTTPTGGPKDEQPPAFESSDPKNNQTNFKGSTIELTFSEPVKLQNPKEQIIIIPPIGKKTEFVAKRNKVLITAQEPWKENTTYTINFQESVQDITEGNPVENLRLAFSTGNYIDSLKIEGYIKDALNETIPQNITVGIFTSDTFNIFEHTPEYFTKTDKEGKFSITNLKPNTYRIYAFQDKNKNLKVESKTEMWGFKKDSLVLEQNLRNIGIALTNIDARPLQLTSNRSIADVSTLRFNKSITEYQIKSNPRITSTFGTDQTEIILYYPKTEADSLSIFVTAIDSLSQRTDTTLFIKRTKNERIKEPYKASFSDIELNTDTRQFKTTYTLNKLPASINLDSIYITIDTTQIIRFKAEQISFDTLKKALSFKNEITLPKDAKAKPKLYLGKSWLITIDNDSTKKEERPLHIINSETTATLSIKVETNHPHYIVQLLNTTGTIIAEQRNNPKPIFKYLKPESIKIRMVIDHNNNGKWDNSNYLENREAEPTYYYLSPEGKYDTPLRANWEVGPLLITSEQNVNKTVKPTTAK